MKKIVIKVVGGLVGLLVLAATGVYLFAPGVVLGMARDAERGAAGLVEHVIEVGDHTITYVDGGAGETLLLVHGFSADLDHWTRMAAHLTDHYRVVALDLPGFGRSTRSPDASYSTVTQVERLDAFTRAIGLERHHVAGNSMGGSIAAVYAATHPDRVASVGLFANGGIQSPRPSELDERRARGEEPLLMSSREDFDEVMRFVFEEVPPVPGTIQDYLAERAVENRDHNERISNELKAEAIDVASYLPRITAPTLVLWGDRDRLLDVSAVDVMKPLLPGGTFVILEGVGHIPMVERPEETARHYREFLGELGRADPRGRG